jgi:disulfide bond formation protein DsbB
MNPAARTALGIAMLAAATVVAALIFEYGFGYAPCHLCLIERWPYYVGVPIALATGLAAAQGARPAALQVGLGLLAIAFLVGFGLGAYHAGVEWKWWAGPNSCTGGAAQVGGNLLQSLRATHFVACDAASWRFLGLSFAGWNAVVSLILAAAAFDGFARLGRR